MTFLKVMCLVSSLKNPLKIQRYNYYLYHIKEY